MADVGPGEAVLVEFGRRQALGVVLGTTDPPDQPTKPVTDRVRSDGPLLPTLALALVRWVASEYLAPPASVLRAALPPGLLERLDSWQSSSPQRLRQGATASGFLRRSRRCRQRTGRCCPRLESGPRPVRLLDAPEGRPAILRRLRALASHGPVQLEWVLEAAGAGPRYERWILANGGAGGREFPSRLASGPPAGPLDRASGPLSRSWPRSRPACSPHVWPSGTGRVPSRG